MRFDRGRTDGLSDQAIGEFQHDRDRVRQWQYRCELETVACEWSLAREYLAKTLNLADTSREPIAAHLQSMPDDFGKAFSLLRWTRIGGMSAAAGEKTELEAFVSALRHAKVQHNAWCVGDHDAQDRVQVAVH